MRNLSVNEYDATIAHTVILLGHSLQLTVIAEGVETKEQLDVCVAWAVRKCKATISAARYPPDLSALLKEGRRLAA